MTDHTNITPFDAWCYTATDPRYPAPFGTGGNLPFLTVMLHRVCGNDHDRFMEAVHIMQNCHADGFARGERHAIGGTDENYLIWSNEHRAWWREDSNGYTVHLDAAGRYTRAEALSIASAARSGWQEGRPPPEIAVREADALFCKDRVAK